MVYRVVVITGAGSGLGASLAEKYSRQGVHVVLLGRNEEKLFKVTDALSSNHSVYVVDVSCKKEIQKVFNSIRKEVGPVDLLINNAGIGSFDLAENISEESIHEMIDINLKGTIFCTQQVLSQMKARNQGCIINIVSTAGKQGKARESVYCASKFGVRGFTESLTLELQETSIQVVGVYMGGMKTKFWNGIFTSEQMKNLMDPDDVADIIMENIQPRKYLTVEEMIIKNKKSFLC